MFNAGEPCKLQKTVYNEYLLVFIGEQIHRSSDEHGIMLKKARVKDNIPLKFIEHRK